MRRGPVGVTHEKEKARRQRARDISTTLNI